MKASTDWLFQKSCAAQQQDNELSLIRGELLYMIEREGERVRSSMMNIHGRLSMVISLRSSWLVVTHTGAGHAPLHNPVIVLYSGGAVHRDKGLYR